MRSRVVIVLITMPLWLACAWWMSGRPSSDGFDELQFTHKLHATDFGMDCTECHPDAATATDWSQQITPTEGVCLDCHVREDDCSWCHTNPENQPPAFADERPQVIFSHAGHMPRVEDDCTACHTAVPESETLPPASPDHETCFGCHEHEQDFARAECSTCHATLQQVPLRAVAAFDHGGDWIGAHGLLAAADDAACASCHVESTCSDCHSRVAPTITARLLPEDDASRTLLHRGDFVTTHGLDALAEGQMCVRCHTPSTCQTCHLEHGVSGTAGTGFYQHPRGWLTPGSSDFHGREAQLHVETCASCHDQGAASNCVTCHQVGASGGNPHPAGWDRDDELSQPPCNACHGGGR